MGKTGKGKGKSSGKKGGKPKMMGKKNPHTRTMKGSV